MASSTEEKRQLWKNRVGEKKMEKLPINLSCYVIMRDKVINRLQYAGATY